MARPTSAKDIKPDDLDAELAAEGGGTAVKSALDLKFIITILVILLAGIGGSVATTLFLAPMVLGPIIQQSVEAAAGKAAEGGEHGAEGEGEGEGGEHGAGHGSAAQTIGNTLELDEFTVNLKNDPAVRGNQFLRTKMSLSIAVPEDQYCSPAPAEHKAQLPSNARFAYATTLHSGRALAAIVPVGFSHDWQASPDAEILLANGGEGGADPMVACKEAFVKTMSPYVPTIRDIINQALMKRTAGTLATVEGQEMLKDDIKTQINTLLEKDYSVVRVNFSDFIIQY